MIFRKMLIIILGVVFMNTLSAQKMRNDPIDVSYTQLPARPLDKSFTTYSVYAVASSYQMQKLGWTRTGLANKIKFSGFKRLDRGGHFNVQVKIGWFNFLGSDVDRKETKTKDKEGNEKVSVSYTKTVQYALPVSYLVRDHQGNIITEQVVSSGDQVKTETFGSASTRSALNKKWSADGKKFLINLEKKYVETTLNNLASGLRRNYDFIPYTNRRDQLEVIKKHKEEAGFDKAYNTVKTAFAKMKADKPLGAIKGEVKPAIEYWEGIVKNYDSGDKKERRMVHAALFNLSTTYYWLDDFTLAKNYAQQCIKDVDWKQGKVKTLLTQIDNAAKATKKNGLDTRHVFRDLSNAVSPAVEYEMAQAEEKAAEEAAIAEANTEKFVGLRIGSSGDQVMGEFNINQTDTDELLFGEGGNVKFMVNNGGEMTEQSLEPDQTTTFAFNDRQFTYLDYQPSHKIISNEAAAPEIMEVLYESKHINVYMFHPRTDKGRSELAIKKATEEKPVSLKGAQFIIFKTGLSNYFSDCPTLSEKASAGEYSNSKEDIIKAAKLYNEECVKP